MGFRKKNYLNLRHDEKSKEFLKNVNVKNTGKKIYSSIATKFLLTVNRWVLTTSILLSIFLALIGLGYIGTSPLRSIVDNQGGLHFLFSAFIGAIITGTSIVVTINQLVLSQELGAVGKQQSRMQNSMDFRQEVEEKIGETIVPPEPAEFTKELISEIKEKSIKLQTDADQSKEETYAAIEDYTDSLIKNAKEVEKMLEDAQFGTFNVIWSALNFNYSEKIHQSRQIQSEHKENLSDRDLETLNKIRDLLTFFGPTREHFKTLYFQWELIKLSRALMYTSIISLVSIGFLIIHINTATIDGSTMGIDNLLIIASIGYTIGVAPFIVFIVFILRIATVAKRTLAMGPFILRENN